MFSLVLTVISILLVAALGAATVFYGGAAVVEAPRAMAADKYREQADQVLSAAQTFRIDNNRWPNSFAELLSTGDLIAIPRGKQEQWAMPFPGVPTFELQGVELAECRYVNSKLRGDSGVLRLALQSQQTQCFGPGVESIRVVVSADPDALRNTYGTANLAPSAALGDPQSTEWLVAPDAPRGSAAQPDEDFSTGQLSVNEGLRDFGDVPFNSSRSLNITLANSYAGAVNTGSLQLAITGQPFADLTVSSTCPTRLAPGASCNLAVVAYATGGEARLVQAQLIISLDGQTLAQVPLRANFVL